MKIFAPEYYNNFKCIADKCKHSCCVGWDVEIDSDTLDKYLKTDDNFAQKIRNNIFYDDGVACFKLDKKKRCPFLKDNGLCEIILEKGENYLCDICSDHPRFRNFFSDRVEIGLGLCCEEVSRIILTSNYLFGLNCIEETIDEESDLDEVEKYVLNMRNEFFTVFQNKAYDYRKCRYEIMRLIEREIPVFTNSDVKDACLPLEMLDKSWGSLVESFSENICHMPLLCDKYSEYAKKLLNYFIFRHFSEAVIDGRIYERAVFSVLSTEIVIGISDYLSDEKLDIEILCDVARRYSSEIEYSDENIEKILDYIAKKSTE